MDIRVAKGIINEKVRYRDSTYILTACTLRRSEKGYFYQAELKELKANCVLIADLEAVTELGKEKTSND